VIGDSITNMFMNGLPFMTFSTTEIDLLMIKLGRSTWLWICCLWINLYSFSLYLRSSMEW